MTRSGASGRIQWKERMRTMQCDGRTRHLRARHSVTLLDASAVLVKTVERAGRGEVIVLRINGDTRRVVGTDGNGW